MTPPAADFYPQDPPTADEGRHGGLTAWLVLMLVLNAIATVILPFVGAALNGVAPSSNTYFSTVLLFAPAALAALNIAFIIALFKYRKWGFWGLCATSVLSIPIIAALGGGPVAGVFAGVVGFIGVGILYAFFNMGSANQKTWPRLK